jgi:hypothetical protein
LPPGVVTVLRSRLPDGTPFSLTLQRIRFQGRQYVCLAVTAQFRLRFGKPAVGSDTTGQCEGPLPLQNRPLVAVMGDPTVCKPHPSQLVWGLALKHVTVVLRSSGRERVAARRAIPPALRARGNVFFIWARSTPDSLLARGADGKTKEIYPINAAPLPGFAGECNHRSPNGTNATLPQSSMLSPPAQQLALLGVLRRPATARDRSPRVARAFTQVFGGIVGIEINYVRVLWDTPSDGMVLLIPAKKWSGPAGPGGQLGYVITNPLCLIVVPPSGRGSGGSCERTGALTGGHLAGSFGTFEYTVVPDGVAKVVAHFHDGSSQTAVVHNNFAGFTQSRLPRAGGAPEQPSSIQWINAAGRTTTPHATN